MILAIIVFELHRLKLKDKFLKIVSYISILIIQKNTIYILA